MPFIQGKMSWLGIAKTHNGSFTFIEATKLDLFPALSCYNGRKLQLFLLIIFILTINILRCWLISPCKTMVCSLSYMNHFDPFLERTKSEWKKITTTELNHSILSFFCTDLFCTPWLMYQNDSKSRSNLKRAADISQFFHPY